MERSICVIPARYSSLRLPGKPLLKLKNKPMVIWVYDAAKNSNVFEEIVIATDDHRIMKVAQQYGARAVMTRKDHPSGSDRVWEVVRNEDYDIVVNLQGDEPFIKPSILSKLVITIRNDNEADIVTPIRKAKNVEEITSRHTAKVIVDNRGMALYFSRAPIPYPRENNFYDPDYYYIHIGIYAYRKEALYRFVQSEPPAIERIESLEQLRALWNGLTIKTVPVDYTGISIDTPEDYEKARNLLGGKND